MNSTTDPRDSAHWALDLEMGRPMHPDLFLKEIEADQSVSLSGWLIDRLCQLCGGLFLTAHELPEDTSLYVANGSEDFRVAEEKLFRRNRKYLLTFTIDEDTLSERQGRFFVKGYRYKEDDDEELEDASHECFTIILHLVREH